MENLTKSILKKIQKNFYDKPKERCGMVIEKDGKQELVMFNNISNSELIHYLAHPQQFYDSLKDTEIINPGGHKIICFVHNHPFGSPEPSTTDLNHAFWNYPYLIVGKKEGKIYMKWFKITVERGVL